jgi:benzoyl-CoA reductase/2-hydroxyglutaryl-CoA dehydratase subunit BcrC/BadD/HgdB
MDTVRTAALPARPPREVESDPRQPVRIVDYQKPILGAIQEAVTAGWEALTGAMEPLSFADGTTLSSAEVLQQLIACAGPYPHAFTDYRHDFGLVEGLKSKYFLLSLRDRLFAASARGVPIVSLRGLPGELVHAGGGMPVDIAIWFTESWLSGDYHFVEKGRQITSFESCPGECAVAAILEARNIPADLVIAASGTVMSDAPCAHTIHRGGRGVRSMFVDIPHGLEAKPWAVQYVAGQFRRATAAVGQLSGKTVRDEDLSQAIQHANEVRRAYREFTDLVLSPAALRNPPVASFEQICAVAPTFEWLGDPVANASLIKALNNEVRRRLANGVRAAGVSEDPVRLFVPGRASFAPIYSLIDDIGAVALGFELFWSFFAEDVDETGDPCQALAEWYLRKWPYSIAAPFEKRIDWLASICEKGQIEGLLFLNFFGCNWDPPVTLSVADAIKRRLGIPSIFLTSDMPEKDAEGRFKIPGQHRTQIEAFIEMLKTQRRP